MTDFIQARNYTKADRSDVRLLVVHSMESPEKPGTARAVAHWFAGSLAPKASAHVCIDNREAVQCVRAEDIAWAAPGANRDGYHIELAGRASQTAEQWDDEYSAAELQLAAEHCAEVAKRYGIPVRKLSVEDVRDGKTRGFCGHVDITKAFRKSDHTDPGPSFPWDRFIAMVVRELEGIATGEVVDALDKRPTDPAPPPEGHPV